MRALALLAMLSCGAPEDALEPEPNIIIPGKITPWLHVHGDTVDGKVVPTGVAFDARPEGWLVTCLSNETPRLEAGRLFCGRADVAQ